MATSRTVAGATLSKQSLRKASNSSSSRSSLIPRSSSVPLPDQKSKKRKRALSVSNNYFTSPSLPGGLVTPLKLEPLLVEKTWLEALPGEFEKPYTKDLCAFLNGEIRNGNDGSGSNYVPVYPPLPLIFNSFNSTPFDKVKVVIIGQDPYHGSGQAMGLSFSVPEGIKIPSSLLNIYKELQQDLGCSIPVHGNLEKWASQGVLLLNAVLTVRQNQANSHAKKGWEQFTDAVITAISQQKKGVVFLLWGNYAQAKCRLIDGIQHHILKAAHPSGLSAHRGFFGCRHFSSTNELLQKMGMSPIDWQL